MDNFLEILYKVFEVIFHIGVAIFIGLILFFISKFIFLLALSQYKAGKYLNSIVLFSFFAMILSATVDGIITSILMRNF